MNKEEIKINKGDIVKVLKGPFKGFYGEFVSVVSDEKGRIKVEMYKQSTKVNLYLGVLKKVIPKCRHCKKILNLTFKEMSNNVLCKKCFNQLFNKRR